MKSIDTIKPVFYITEDNKKIIKESIGIATD